MGMKFSCSKSRKITDAYKIGAAISDPRLAGGKMTDIRLFSDLKDMSKIPCKLIVALQSKNIKKRFKRYLRGHCSRLLALWTPQPVACYTISASAPRPLLDPLCDSERDCKALSRPISHPNTGGSPQLHRSKPLGGAQPRDSSAIVFQPPLKQPRNKNGIETAILNRVLDCD